MINLRLSDLVDQQMRASGFSWHRGKFFKQLELLRFVQLLNEIVRFLGGGIVLFRWSHHKVLNGFRLDCGKVRKFSKVKKLQVVPCYTLNIFINGKIVGFA